MKKNILLAISIIAMTSTNNVYSGVVKLAKGASTYSSNTTISNSLIFTNGSTNYTFTITLSTGGSTQLAPGASLTVAPASGSKVTVSITAPGVQAYTEPSTATYTLGNTYTINVASGAITLTSSTSSAS